MAKLEMRHLAAVAALSLGLTACGQSGDNAEQSENSKNKVEELAAPPSPSATAAGPSAPNLAAGPDVCFKAIVNHLGKDTKVAEFAAFFSAGSEIDSSNREPQGQMTSCAVDYQSPDDPRKLVGTRMDLTNGTFSPPHPIEITVMGNAADFKLDDHLIPLSQLDPAGLTTVMEAQKARLSGLYGKYAWTGVRLSSPDAFSAKHTLRLDLTGRLAANDIKNVGYASVTTDGKKITADHLAP